MLQNHICCTLNIVCILYIFCIEWFHFQLEDGDYIVFFKI